MHPPLQGEQRAGVVQAKEMDHRDERDGEQVLVPVRAPWPSPLLQGVVELLGVPAELTLDKQVNCRGVMPGFPNMQSGLGASLQQRKRCTNRESHTMKLG